MLLAYWLSEFLGIHGAFEFRCYIRITCPCDLYHLASHFYIVKLGFTEVYIFSSPEPKAQRLRLIGELIVYPCSVVHPSIVLTSSVVHNFKHPLL